MTEQFPREDYFPHSPPTPPSTDNRRWLWLVPAAGVVIAVALVGAFLVFRSGTSPNPAAIGDSGSAAPISPTTVTETITSTASVPASPSAASHDLGLARPIVVPRCTGQTVVFLESIPVTTPDLRDQVRKWIEPWEFGPLGAADYLHSQAACSSVRSVDDNGQPFYAVFAAPAGDVCARFNAVRNSLPPGAYPRLLSDSVAPGYNPCAR